MKKYQQYLLLTLIEPLTIAYPSKLETYWRGAYQKAGELDKSITEYERLITFDPNSKNRLLIYPKYHYRLAKSYEEKGVASKAIEQYDKFLEIWKNADEDLPDLIDAKARLARLKENSK